MSEERTFVKRRHMFIEPYEQVVFMIRAWLYCIVFFVGALLPIYKPGPGWHLSEAQRATNQFFFYHADKWPWLLLPFALVGLMSVIGSHRIFGPVTGLKNTLKRVTEKDLTARFSGRPGDHFGELSLLVNDVIDRERENLKAIRDLAAKAESDLAAGRSAEAHAGIRKLIDEIGRYHLDLPKNG
ncbi:MAG: methyl-accepting chemotaxis protein [Deltaproteobacteria bacterium]|nr:methyl-accepting chemotaxis protein [Deltaproteobacteria bacterium]